MPRIKSVLPRRDAAIIVCIVLAAAVLSLASYEYSASISSGVLSASLSSNSQNAQIEANDLSHIYSSQIQQVISYVVSIANSPAIQEQNVSEVTALLETAQNYSKPFTDYYGWNGANGSLLADSNQTILALGLEKNSNQTYRSAIEAGFAPIGAKGVTYISNASISPLTHLARIGIIQPVYNSSHVY